VHDNLAWSNGQMLVVLIKQPFMDWEVMSSNPKYLTCSKLVPCIVCPTLIHLTLYRITVIRCRTL